MSDWWSMENSRTYFCTFLLLLLADWSQSPLCVRLCPTWTLKTLMTASFKSYLQWLINYHYTSQGWSFMEMSEDLCRRVSLPPNGCFLIDCAKLIILIRSFAAWLKVLSKCWAWKTLIFSNSLFALQQSVSLPLISLQTKLGKLFHLRLSNIVLIFLGNSLLSFDLWKKKTHLKAVGRFQRSWWETNFSFHQWHESSEWSQGFFVFERRLQAQVMALCPPSLPFPKALIEGGVVCSKHAGKHKFSTA